MSRTNHTNIVDECCKFIAEAGRPLRATDLLTQLDVRNIPFRPDIIDKRSVRSRRLATVLIDRTTGNNPRLRKLPHGKFDLRMVQSQTEAQAHAVKPARKETEHWKPRDAEFNILENYTGKNAFLLHFVKGKPTLTPVIEMQKVGSDGHYIIRVER